MKLTSSTPSATAEIPPYRSKKSPKNLDTPWKIDFLPSARAILKKLPANLRREIFAQILDLRNDPHPGHSVQLRGLRKLYRLRIGGYRVVYRLTRSRTIVVERIRRRADAYRGFAPDRRTL